MRALIPNSTPIPDVLLDHWMGELSGAEFKVLLYIARRTYGFGKEWDTISLNQISNGIRKRDGTVLDHGTGISRASVIRALNTLETKKIVIRQLNQRKDSREFEENTYSINLAWELPYKKSGSGSGGTQGGGAVGKKQSCHGVVSKRDYLVSKQNHVDSNDDMGWSQNETTVVSKLDLQETDQQETVQETASTGESLSNRAADALIENLVREGVGHAVARNLVRQNPGACKLQLEYLPFAEIKKSKGAWLASAIRGEFGPPAGYVKAQFRLKAERAKALTSAKQVEHRSNTLTMGREAFERISKTNPDAFEAFLSHLNMQRERTAKLASSLTANREMVLAHLQSDDFRYEQFNYWVRGAGAKYFRDPSVRQSGKSD